MEIMSWFRFVLVLQMKVAPVCFTVMILFACCKAYSSFYCNFVFVYSALVIE